jgi:hypothetical protein
MDLRRLRYIAAHATPQIWLDTAHLRLRQQQISHGDALQHPH